MEEGRDIKQIEDRNNTKKPNRNTTTTNSKQITEIIAGKGAGRGERDGPMTAIVTCSSTATRTFRLVITRPLSTGGLDDVRDVVPRTLHVHRGGGRVLAHGGFSPHVGAVPVVPGGCGPRSIVGSVADDPITER